MDNPTPVSKTSIGDFLFCPWFWYAIRILKRKKEIGIAAMNGINVHNLVAQIITGVIDLPAAFASATNSQVIDLLTATNTWWPLEELKEQCNAGNLLVEQTVYATKTGRRVKTSRSAIVMGIVDLAFIPDSNVGRIDDWKSGAWEQDDPLERDLYAGVIGPSLFPLASCIVFTLRFMRTGNILRSTYQFSSSRQTCIVTDPFGQVVVRIADENPFLKNVKDIIAEIEATKPIPKHGAHCKKHYGQPCQFYADATCPYWEKKLKEK